MYLTAELYCLFVRSRLAGIFSAVLPHNYRHNRGEKHKIIMYRLGRLQCSIGREIIGISAITIPTLIKYHCTKNVSCYFFLSFFFYRWRAAEGI